MPTQQLSSNDTIAYIESAGRTILTQHPHGKLTWRRWGESGPHLVLLHGGHGAWSHWIRNVVPLSKWASVIVPDIPGFGDSDAMPRPHRVELLAASLLSGLDQALGVASKFSVVGFSFGGAVGGHLAQQAGTRLDTFVMVGAGGLGFPRADIPDLIRWRGIEDAAERNAIHRRNLEILMIYAAAKIDDLAVTLQARNTPRCSVNSRAISMLPVLRDVMPSIRGRLAGIWGEQDAPTGKPMQPRIDLIRSIQPIAPFVVIPGAGHWVQYEAAEAFNQALREVIEAGA